MRCPDRRIRYVTIYVTVVELSDILIASPLLPPSLAAPILYSFVTTHSGALHDTFARRPGMLGDTEKKYNII